MKTSWIRFSLVFVLAIITYIGHTQIKCDTANWVSSYGSDSTLAKAIDQWYVQGHYNKLLKKHGIKKISCASCDGAYIDLDFSVSHYGQIIPAKINTSRICSGPANNAFISDFYASLKHIKVPVQYAGKCYRYRFGRVLKC